MVGLLDIAPVAKRVLVPSGDGEVEVEVHGLSVTAIRDLIVAHPEFLRKIGSGLTAESVQNMGPDIVGTVIALACTNGEIKWPSKESAKARQIAMAIGGGVQAEILTAAIKLTMPRGPGPFVAMLEAMGVDLRGAALSATTLQPPLNS